MASQSDTGPLPTTRSHDRGAEYEPHPSFGHRVEKILFVAEQEAAETRRSATRESTALIERARVEAETLRRDGEQAVRAFRAEAEWAADQRTTELDAREREIEWYRDNARIDAERCLAEARREADRIVAAAVGDADSVRAEFEEELAERHAEVERQMAWLEESRRAARDLAHMLLAQVGDAAAEPTTDPEPPTPPGHRTSVPSALEPGPERDETAAAVTTATTAAVTTAGARDDDRSQWSADGTPQARPPSPDSPYVEPSAELRFAGTFGGVLGSESPDGSRVHEVSDGSDLFDGHGSDERTVSARYGGSEPEAHDLTAYGDTTERLYSVTAASLDPRLSPGRRVG